MDKDRAVQTLREFIAEDEQDDADIRLVLRILDFIAGEMPNGWEDFTDDEGYEAYERLKARYGEGE